MASARAELRRAGYGLAAGGFASGAFLARFRDVRAGLVASSIGGAALAVGVWADLVAQADERHAAAKRAEKAEKAAADAHARLVAISKTLTALTKKVDGLAASADAAKIVAGRLDNGVVQLHKQIVDFRTNQFEKRHGAVLKRFDHVDTEVDRAPGVTVELSRILGRVQPAAPALPTTGGWALSAGTLIGLVDEVLRDDTVATVVECGSGTSTVWVASAMRTRGAGHVYALEHDVEYAEVTREQLRRHELQDWATVLDAPLSDVELEGEQVRWFDPAAVAQLPAQIDLLLVDGPPGASGPLARRPAYATLRDRLTAGSRVVLDDTDRDEEQQIAADWTGRDDAGQRLVARATVGRSTFFEVVTAP